MSEFKPINFLDIFHTNNDRETVISMVNERIQMRGWQCTLYRYKGSQVKLGDPLYQDTLSIHDRDESLYDVVPTHIEIDYNRFNSILHSYGLAIEEGTTLPANMMLKDKPQEDDIIDIKIPYDQKFYRFRIGSTDIHADICYHVVLNIYMQDNNKEVGEIKYNVEPDTENTDTITAKSTRQTTSSKRQY